jgi:flagellar hook-length control protein FliK
MKIKSQAVRMQVETEIKPVTTSPNADVSGATKVDTATTRSENLSRTQFILEPETFRSPTKLPAEIRLRLVPESLGVLKLTLRAVANHLTARVIVQSAAARMAVEGNLAELQRTLADAGLVIDRFAVTVGHTAGASPTHPDTDSQRRRYAYKPKTYRRYQAAAGIKKSTPVADAPPNAAAMSMGQYTLNMVA